MRLHHLNLSLQLALLLFEVLLVVAVHLSTFLTEYVGLLDFLTDFVNATISTPVQKSTFCKVEDVSLPVLDCPFHHCLTVLLIDANCNPFIKSLSHASVVHASKVIREHILPFSAQVFIVV